MNDRVPIGIVFIKNVSKAITKLLAPNTCYKTIGIIHNNKHN